jgi:hypothetical protein
MPLPLRGETRRARRWVRFGLRNYGRGGFEVDTKGMAENAVLVSATGTFLGVYTEGDVNTSTPPL